LTIFGISIITLFTVKMHEKRICLHEGQENRNKLRLEYRNYGSLVHFDDTAVLKRMNEKQQVCFEQMKKVAVVDVSHRQIQQLIGFLFCFESIIEVRIFCDNNPFLCDRYFVDH